MQQHTARVRMPSATASRHGANSHSPPIRRYFMTMLCAILGATIALWVSSLESKSIERATEDSHRKRGAGGNRTRAYRNKRLSNGRRRRRNVPDEKGNATNETSVEVGGESDNDSPQESVTNEKESNKTTISILGERNTGTRWIVSELQRCFPDYVVKPRLVRWKHWFQDDVDEAYRKPTLVIAQFRNVYEWVEAMRKVPHHAPNHMYLEWKEFVTKPWTIDRPKRDEKMKDEKGTGCYEKFSYNELVSCVEGSRSDPDFRARQKLNRKEGYYSGHKPIYELKRDKSGKPYDNILELRTAKIENFLSVKDWTWVQEVLPAQYETLLEKGTDDLLTLVEKALGANRTCTAAQPQIRKKRNVTKEYVDYLNEHVNWDVEKMAGYDKNSFISESQIITEDKKSKKDEGKIDLKKEKETVEEDEEKDDDNDDDDDSTGDSKEENVGETNDKTNGEEDGKSSAKGKDNNSASNEEAEESEGKEDKSNNDTDKTEPDEAESNVENKAKKESETTDEDNVKTVENIENEKSKKSKPTDVTGEDGTLDESKKKVKSEVEQSDDEKEEVKSDDEKSDEKKDGSEKEKTEEKEEKDETSETKPEGKTKEEASIDDGDSEADLQEKR